MLKMLAEAQNGYVPAELLAVSEYLDRYLEAVGPKLKPGSFRNSKAAVGFWKGIIGKIPLGKVTPMEVQSAIPKLPSFWSAATKRNTIAILRAALRQAVKWELIPRDPGVGVIYPNAAKKEMKVWTKEDAAKFLSVAGKETRVHALFHLALATGMRQGELLALRWEDVDLQTGTVAVRRSLFRDNGDRDCIFQEPKTAFSRRKIPLDIETVKKIKSHRKSQLEERLAAGSEWNEYGLLFCTRKGEPLRGTYLRKALSMVTRKAGVPVIRFHDLRHTHATLLLQAGVHLKVVSERLGHANTNITLSVYSHVLPDMQEAAVKAIEGMFVAATRTESRRNPVFMRVL